MSSAGSQVLENFRASKEYRHAFVAEKLQTQIAAQIRAIREQRGLTRPRFAQMLGKSPSWVFRLEDPNEPPPTVNTLLDVARAYDVDLEVYFSPFSALVNKIDHLTPESFEVPSFDEEMEEAEALREEEADGTIQAITLKRRDGGEKVIEGQEITDEIRTFFADIEQRAKKKKSEPQPS